MALLDMLGDPFGAEGATTPRVPTVVQGPGSKVAEPIPPHLEGVDRRLWIIRAEIDKVRDSLQKAHTEGQLSRVSSLTRELRNLLEDEAALQPPRRRTVEEEAAQFEAEARAVVAKIEAAIAAAEERIKL